MDEVFRVRTGVLGDGDLLRGLGEAAVKVGVIGKYALAEGERGVSSKLGAESDALEWTGLGDDANASKALILDCTPAETSSDIVGENQSREKDSVHSTRRGQRGRRRGGASAHTRPRARRWSASAC